MRDFLGAERNDDVFEAELRAGLDHVVPATDLRLARGHVQRPGLPVPRVDTVGLAPLADSAHRALGGATHVNRPGIPDAVSQDREVVPEGRHEAPVPAAGAVAGQACLEHDDVGPGLELLQLPGRPETEITATDDDDVRGRVSRQGGCPLDRPGLLEPVAVPRVAHCVHRARA